MTRRRTGEPATDQIGLFGDDSVPLHFVPEALPDSRKAAAYTLFFGIFVPGDRSGDIARRAEQLRLQHGLRGPCHEPERLHVTLSTVLKNVAWVESALVDACLAAGDSVDWQDLQLRFHGAGGFTNSANPGNSAYVLRCDEPSRRRLLDFYATLSAALRRHAVRHDSLQTPHMTMLYDQPIAEHAIAPIDWTASGFALVLSHVGRHHHQFLRRWPVTAESGG